MFDRRHTAISRRMFFYASRSLGSMIALMLLVVASQTRASADSVSQTFQLSAGSTPQWVAVTPDNSTVFVTNSNQQTVSVFSVSGNQISIIHTIKPGLDLGMSNANPAGIGVTPDGTQFWICLPNLNKVAVYNIVPSFPFPTFTFRASVNVGLFPFAVAFKHNSGQAYVTNNSSGTVSVISVASDTVTNTVTVGNGPAGITNAFDPVGGTNTIFVANQNDNTVSYFHPSDLIVGTIAGAGSAPFGIASGTSGSVVYVTNISGDSMQVIDANLHTITKTVNNASCTIDKGVATTCLQSPRGVTVISTVDGDRVYVANGTDNSVAKFKGVGVYKSKVSVGTTPMGVGSTFSDTLIFCANQFSDSISVIDSTL